MNNKLRRYVGLIILTISLLGILSGCSKVGKAEQFFEQYKELWIKQDFDSMYEMLASESKDYISKEEFVNRYNNIYSAIEVSNLFIEKSGEVVEGEEEITIPFTLKMDTIAGNLHFDNFQAVIVKEDKTYKIKWDESLIMPQMIAGDAVRISTISAVRGSILDRDGNKLAYDGTINTVGIYPADFDKENKEDKISELAQILDISEETINNKLEANSNPEYFVPIVDILPTDDKLSKLQGRESEGVIIYEKQGRVYTGGEAFGRLIGYIGHITAEELEANVGKGYTEISLIGKAGLEQIYEEKLRGKDAVEIYLERGSDKISVIATSVENGEDITLSIDSELQKKTYNEMDGEKGAASAVNPTTGEVLALVSAPSYDSNVFTTYVTKTQKAEWESNDYADEVNRFNKLYSPGSTMKLITSAVGLENSSIKANETRDITGLSWQKDSSWGDYKITRVTDPGHAENLRDAVNHSDNIYFGQVALELGTEKFINGIKKFGIGEEIPFEYPMEASQISNDGTLSGEIALADTGYGQGQLMVTPLNITLAYSSLANEGNIMQPRLVISENLEAKLWKEGAIAKDNLTDMVTAFTSLINDADGTVQDGKVSGFRIAGKTGTAEIKASQDDTEGTENGWFAAVDVDGSKIAISMIIEDVKGRNPLGGSHVTVPKVKNVMEYYLTR